MTLANPVPDARPIPADPATRAIGPRHMALVAGLVVAHVVLAWLGRVPAVTTGNDDALYLLLARGLQSFHYADAHILGSPAHSQYPPGYPAMLALWTAGAGSSLDAALAFGILCSALTLVLAFDLTRRLAGVLPALAVLACLAVNPALLNYAGRVASESPFMMLVTATAWAMIALPEGPKRFVVVALLALAASMTRTIGISLVGAVGLVWLLERRYRVAGAFGMFAAGTVGGWILWTALAPDKFVARSYTATVIKTANRAGNDLIHALWERGMTAARVYGAGSVPSSLPVPTIPGFVLDNLFWSGLIAVLLAAGLVMLWKRNRMVTVFLVAYGVILWIWPHKMTRFVVPLIPLLLLVIVVGATGLLRRWRVAALTAAVGLPLLWAGNGLGRDLRLLEVHADCSREDPLHSPGCFNGDQRAFFSLLDYVREHTDSSAVFVTLKEATFAWYTGRRVYYPHLVARHAGEIPAFLRREGVDYLVLGRLIRTPRFDLARELLPVCSELDLVREFTPDTYLFRVRPAGEPAGDAAACDAIRHFVEGDRKPDPLVRSQALSALTGGTGVGTTFANLRSPWKMDIVAGLAPAGS